MEVMIAEAENEVHLRTEVTDLEAQEMDQENLMIETVNIVNENVIGKQKERDHGNERGLEVPRTVAQEIILLFQDIELGHLKADDQDLGLQIPFHQDVLPGLGPGPHIHKEIGRGNERGLKVNMNLTERGNESMNLIHKEDMREKGSMNVSHENTILNLITKGTVSIQENMKENSLILLDVNKK